jgi:predicted SprT family Zn-dependent metalloprotease
MKIPKKINLAGKTIKVDFVKDLRTESDAIGEAVYRKNAIRLQPSCEGASIPKESLEQAFFHELVHFILYEIGEDELRDNERFVTSFSGLLHQALKEAMK